MDELFSSPDLYDFPLSLHMTMLRDEARLKAYSSAISKVVSKGDVVLDVGSGTGVLSMFAARAGAKKVYAVEDASIATYAKEVIEKNSLSDVIEVVNLDILSEEMPEIQADVVICELFGSFGIGENLVQIMRHVRDNFMKENGKMLPEDMHLWQSPVECSAEYGEIADWNRQISNIDFSSLQSLAYNAVYLINNNAAHTLAEPQIVQSVDFMKLDDPVDFSSIQFQIRNEGILHGIAGWFSTTLSSGVELNSGLGHAPTHWGQILLPTGRPFSVDSGDRLEFKFSEETTLEDSVWSWSGSVTGKDNGMENHTFSFEAKRE